MMRIFIRTSRWAIWARRLASFALPLTVFSIVMHRARLISSEIFTLLLVLVFAVAVATVVTAIIAFARLWNTGDKGWSRSIQAFLLGLLLLSPLAFTAPSVSRYPNVNDVTTDSAGLPALAFADNPNVAPISAPQVTETWPNAAPRTYQIDASALFELIENLVLEQDWEIWRKRAPVASVSDGEIHAVATTLLGWRDEVSISIRPTLTGSVVNVRSASFWGVHDLGTNGRRVEAFLLALDADVNDALRALVPVTKTDGEGGS